MNSYCTNCGKKIDNAAHICTDCGIRVAVVENQNSNSERTNGLAIAGFISSFFISLVGLILSIVGLNQIKKTNERGKGLAIAGIVISSAKMVLTVLATIFIIIAINIGIESGLFKEIYDEFIDEVKKQINDVTDRADSDLDEVEGFNKPISFNGFILKIKPDYTFEESDGKIIIKVPVYIKNINIEPNYLNFMLIDVFDPDGEDVRDLNLLLKGNDSIVTTDSLRKGESYIKYLYITYNGDGNYLMVLNNYTEEKNIIFNITK